MTWEKSEMQSLAHPLSHVQTHARGNYWKTQVVSCASGAETTAERPHPATAEPTTLLPAFHLTQAARYQPWTSRSRHGSAWSGCSLCTEPWPGTPAPCRWASGQKLQRQTRRSGAASPCRWHLPGRALRASPPRRRSASSASSWFIPFLNDRKSRGGYSARQTCGWLCGQVSIGRLAQTILRDWLKNKQTNKQRKENSDKPSSGLNRHWDIRQIFGRF